MPDDFDGSDAWRQAWQLIQEEADELLDSFEENITEGWNAIQRIRHFDCHGQWVVYIQTIGPAALRAMWLLLVPSLDEIIENYLNPKSGRGGSRRGRRSRRRWRRAGTGARRLFFSRGIPDIDESIARFIPGGEAVRGRRVGPGEWLFWTGIDAADRVLWYFLLTEVFETFQTVWQSEIMESGQCQTALASQLSFNWLHSPASSFGPLWQSKSQITTAKELKANIGATGTVSAPTGFAWYGSLALDWEIRNVEQNDAGPVTRQYDLIVEGRDLNGDAVTLATESTDIVTNPSGLSSGNISVHLDLAGITEVTFRFERFIIEANGGLIDDRFAGTVMLNAQARVTNE